APVGEHRRTERPVKPDRLFVPVEHRPFEPAAAPLHREAGKVDQKGAAVAPATEVGLDEQVLQVEPAPPQECREIVKKKGKRHRIRAVPAKNNLSGRSSAKECRVEIGLRGYAQIGKFFVIGEPANHCVDSPYVLAAGGANVERSGWSEYAHTPRAYRI